MTSDKPEKQITVLVVDDEWIVTDVLSTILARAGYRVEVAHGGREGIDAAVRALPNLIIMDIRMPDMDGVRAAGEIRRKPELENVPIVFLTGEAAGEIDVDKMPGPAPSVLGKPLSSSQIIFLTRDLLLAVPDMAKNR